MEPTLTERVRELVLDAEVEREALERRKAELLTEREEKVAEVREEYRAKLDEIEASLTLAARLRRALDPEGAKREAAEKAAAKRERKAAQRKPGAPSQGWRPSAEVFEAVYRAMAETGAETVNQIAEVPGVTVSTSTVKLALDYARQEGTVRLAGQTGRGGAKVYRLTPEGHEHLTSNGRTVVSNA